MLTKRNFLLLSIIGIVVVFILNYSVELKLCSALSSMCYNRLNLFAGDLWIFFPVLFFSLVTYFMRQEVFRAWAWFTVIFVPTFLVLMFLIPEGNPGGGFGVPSFSLKAAIWFLFLISYIVISIVIIVGRYLVLWWNKK